VQATHKTEQTGISIKDKYCAYRNVIPHPNPSPKERDFKKVSSFGGDPITTGLERVSF
jgi:hypothetical protein